MSFLQPLFLIAGILIAVPFIIHLIGERKYQSVSFSSLKFLHEIERESLQKLQWRQWLVLLSRSLWIAMLVLALGQPFLQKGQGKPDAGILVADQSFSTRIDPEYLALEKSIYDHFPSWKMVRYDRRTSVDSLQRDIDHLIKTYQLDHAPVIYITDLQDNDLNRNVLAMLRKTDRLYVVSGPKTKANRALEQLKILPRAAEKSHMNELNFRVSANDLARNHNVVTIGLDGKQAGRAEIDPLSGMGVFLFGPTEQNITSCIVKTEEDDYPEDNIRYLVIRDPMEKNILCINDPKGGYYHINALRSLSGVKVREITPEEISNINLEDFDMIWFSEPYQLNSGQYHLIQLFAKGNPVIICSGREGIVPAVWKDLLGRLGESEYSQESFSALAAPWPQDMRVRKYFVSSLEPEERIVDLTSGDPLLIQSKENFYVFLSPFHFEWNEMGLSPYFTRVLNTLLELMIGKETASYYTGDVITVTQPLSVIVTPSGERYQVKDRFTETEMPGFYRVENEDEIELIAVNIPPEECEQNYITEDDLVVIDGTKKTMEEIEAQIIGRPAQNIFIILALIFIIFEMILLRKGERTR